MCQGDIVQGTLAVARLSSNTRGLSVRINFKVYSSQLGRGGCREALTTSAWEQVHALDGGCSDVTSATWTV
jgi:hypothetical protein